MGNGHLLALVPLRQQHDLGSKGFGASERLGNVGYADIKDGVALVSWTSADATCGGRCVMAGHDE